MGMDVKDEDDDDDDYEENGGEQGKGRNVHYLFIF